MFTNQTGGQVAIIIYILLFAAIYYFLLVLPQRRRAQEKQKLMENLRINDEVVTIGGIIGTIRDIRKDVIVLQVSENVTIRLAKEAVATSLAKPEE